MKRSLDVIEKHIGNGGFESVLHAIGIYRTNINNSHMDWALIRCQDPGKTGFTDT
jgi:hypothetical protein